MTEADKRDAIRSYIKDYVDCIVSPELIDITCIRSNECMTRSGEHAISVVKATLDTTVECEIIFEETNNLFCVSALLPLEDEEDNEVVWQTIYFGGDQL